MLRQTVILLSFDLHNVTDINENPTQEVKAKVSYVQKTREGYASKRSFNAKFKVM